MMESSKKERLLESLQVLVKREERIARIEVSSKSGEEVLEKVTTLEGRVARIESGNRSAEGSRHSLQMELGERTEDARQLVLKLQVAEARIVELDLDKLWCQLARGKEVEGLRQAVKDSEKKLKEQLEAWSRERLYLGKQLHGKHELLREPEFRDKRRQVQMLWEELAGCRFGAAPGGSWSRLARCASPRPRLARPEGERGSSWSHAPPPRSGSAENSSWSRAPAPRQGSAERRGRCRGLAWRPP